MTLNSQMTVASFCASPEPHKLSYLTEKGRSCTLFMFLIEPSANSLPVRSTFIKGDPYIRDMKNTSLVSNYFQWVR